MVYAIGQISGCHINPAITIAMLVNRKIGSKDAALYIVVQCIGAIIVSLILLAIMTGLAGYDLATNGLGQNGGGRFPGGFSLASAFIAEVVLTFIFSMVVFGATRKKAPAGFAGIAIGLSLAMIHMVGIPITGTSMNPARSLGPALVAGGPLLPSSGCSSSRRSPARWWRQLSENTSLKREQHRHNPAAHFFIPVLSFFIASALRSLGISSIAYRSAVRGITFLFSMTYANTSAWCCPARLL